MPNTRRSRTLGPAPNALGQGIGVQNERSLHNAIKAWYARPGDEFEVKRDSFIIDICRGDLLIEIQTRNFSVLRRKLRTLVQHYQVRLVYPLALEKWITRTDASGRRTLGKRKSPRRGDIADLFDERVAIPDLINDPNFELDVLLIHEEEIRRDDGNGSWWRRGYSRWDRKLIEVVESVSFKDKYDFLRFLPAGLPQPFSNTMLAHALARHIYDVRKMTYCLRKMDVIVPVGKNRNEVLFEIADENGEKDGVSDPETRS